MVNTRRNSTAIIFYRDRIVFMNGYLYMGTVSCKSLINGIVHNLIYQMMKASERCIINIHSRSLSDCFQSLQNLNLICSVFVIH